MKTLAQQIQENKKKELEEHCALLNEILHLQLHIDNLEAKVQWFDRKFGNQNKHIASLHSEKGKHINLLLEKENALNDHFLTKQRKFKEKTLELLSFFSAIRKESNSEKERQKYDEFLDFLSKLHD